MTENVRGKLPRTTGWQPVLPGSGAQSIILCDYYLVPGHQSRFTFLRLRDDQRRQIRLLNQFAYLGDFFLLDLRPLL